MGQKTHPVGFRLGVTEGWKSNWFSNKNYKEKVIEDCRLREFLKDSLSNAGLAKIEIDRSFNDVKVTLHVSRPGVVIGRGGSGIEMLKDRASQLVEGALEIDVQEVKQPDLSASLVAQNIVYQLSRRRPFRRVMNYTADRVMDNGAKGVKIQCKGLLGGTQIARAEQVTRGKIPLQSLKADIDFARDTVNTQKGTIGVKVWIYRGDQETI